MITQDPVVFEVFANWFVDDLFQWFSKYSVFFQVIHLYHVGELNIVFAFPFLY